MISEISFSISEYRSFVIQIGGFTFLRMTTPARRRYDTELAERLTIYELRTALKSLSSQNNSTQMSNAELQQEILVKLHDLTHVFKKVTVDRLSSHRLYDLKIDLKEDFESSFE
jgi:hypothetical protein